MARGENYEEFVGKFEPKLTTDDCYTPPEVYDVVADWVADRYGIDRGCFVRPFYPNGDYQNEDYSGKIVVDNPPFSILSKIIAWYHAHGVKFFLFAPNTSTLNCTRLGYATAVCVGVSIVYDNGAIVNTNFVTNLESADVIAFSAPELYERIKQTVESKEKLRKYALPDCVVTTSKINYMAAHGVDYVLHRGGTAWIGSKKVGTEKASTYGGGYFLNDKATAEKVAAEKRADENKAAKKFEAVEKIHLTDGEKELIERLNSEVANGTI